MTAFAALIWSIDNDVLLRSTRPELAWLAVGVMWVEIAGLCVALIRRYRRRLTGLGLPLGIAFAALGLNFVGALVLWPAIVLG